jgi:hypothetical protein
MRPLLTVCAAVAVFGMTIRTLGCRARGDRDGAGRHLGRRASSVRSARSSSPSVMAVLSVLIFIYALGMPLQIVAWPVW